MIHYRDELEPDLLYRRRFAGDLDRERRLGGVRRLGGGELQEQISPVNIRKCLYFTII